MIRVTAAVLRRGGEVLLARRTGPSWLAGKWEFPGGKVQAGEDPRASLARELREELGIECRVGEHLLTTTHAYPELEVEIAVYRAEHLGGELVPVEHDRVAWVALEALTDYDLAPADRPIAAAVAREGGG